MFTYVHTYIQTHIHIYIYIHMCVYTYVCIHMYVCMYVCMYVLYFLLTLYCTVLYCIVLYCVVLYNYTRSPKPGSAHGSNTELRGQRCPIPDPREDLKSRSPNLGTLATKGHFIGTPLRDLLFGCSRGSGMRVLFQKVMESQSARAARDYNTLATPDPQPETPKP